MKKIITGACILLVTVMFSPAMAQDSPNEQQNRQGNRINKHINGQGGHWRGQGSTRFANSRGHRIDKKLSRYHYQHRKHRYYRYHHRHNRHMYSWRYNRHNRHLYSGFYNRYHRHLYPMRNHGHYRHRKHW